MVFLKYLPLVQAPSPCSLTLGAVTVPAMLDFHDAI